MNPKTRRGIWGVLWMTLPLAGVMACDQTVDPVCGAASENAPTLDAGPNSATPLVLSTTTVTVTNSTTNIVDGGNTTVFVDASSTVTTTTTMAPVTVFLDLQLVATFVCPIEGVAHATLVTSAGQFTNGLPTSSGGAGGGGGGSGGGGSDSGGGSSSSAGSSGVSNASVTVLLTNQGGVGYQAGVTAPGTQMFGYTTLQLTTQRSAQVQIAMGDVSSCQQICLGRLQASGCTVSSQMRPRPVPFGQPADADLPEGEASTAASSDEAGDGANGAESSDGTLVDSGPVDATTLDSGPAAPSGPCVNVVLTPCYATCPSD